METKIPCKLSSIRLSTPDWVKLWHFRDLDDTKFLPILSNVEKQWKEKIFKAPGEILHLSGLYLMLSQLGLYNKNKEEIVLVV